MKIGMILDNTFPPDPRVENEAGELIRNGFEVFLFCITFQPAQPVKENHNGIHVTRKRYSPVVRKLAALAYSNPVYHRMLKPAIKKFIAEIQPDAIHVHDLQIARAVFQVNKNHNLPVILDLHENRPEIMKFYPHVNRFPGNVMINPATWKKFENKYIKRSLATIVVTEEAKKHYQQKPGLSEKQFIVVPNTVTRSFISNYTIEEKLLNRYEKDFMLLYIGDTGTRRGTMTMVDSAFILKDKIPNLKYVLVGKSKDDRELAEYVEKKGVKDRIDFEGWQSPALFQSYILASNACLSPILRNPHHDTTYANKIFQYLSMGKPVIVSDCPAQSNMVKTVGCGLVHEAGNPEDLAEKILQLYVEPELSERFGKNGRQFILEHFTWDKTAKGMINLYKMLDKNLIEERTGYSEH